jgi:hypothetical protein
MAKAEILEAQKLIADMKNILVVLAGATDADKLIALVREKGPRMVDKFEELGQQFRPTIFEESPETLKGMESMAIWIVAIMSLSKRAVDLPDDKAKLVARVAEYAPRIMSGLDKVAQALNELELQQSPNQAMQPTASPRAASPSDD